MIAEKIQQYIREKDLQGFEENLTEDQINELLEATGERLSYATQRQLLPTIPGKSRQGKLYPSEGTKCCVAGFFRHQGIPGEPLNARAVMTFLYGDYIEAGLLLLAGLSGASIFENNKPMEVMVNGKPRRGRSDGKHKDEENVIRNVEVKSMSGFSFRRFLKEGMDDQWGYLGQCNLYMRQMLGDGVISAPGETILVAINKDTLNIAEKIIRYDPQYARHADENFAVIEEAASKGLMPERPYQLEKNRKLGLNCSYCPMKYNCWTEPKQIVTFTADGEPRYKDPLALHKHIVKKLKSDRWGSMRPEYYLSVSPKNEPEDKIEEAKEW
jgi:hypothetical protein